MRSRACGNEELEVVPRRGPQSRLARLGRLVDPGLDQILEFCARDPVERVFLEDVARRGLGRFVALEDGTIRFKAEASAWTPSAVQLQQVWVEPSVRGRGYAQRGMRDLCRQLLERVPAVCLFVRAENAVAIHVYESIGMRRTIAYRSLIF